MFAIIAYLATSRRLISDTGREPSVGRIQRCQMDWRALMLVALSVMARALRKAGDSAASLSCLRTRVACVALASSTRSRDRPPARMCSAACSRASSTPRTRTLPKVTRLSRARAPRPTRYWTINDACRHPSGELQIPGVHHTTTTHRHLHLSATHRAHGALAFHSSVPRHCTHGEPTRRSAE